jgi:hypothetical protein
VVAVSLKKPLVVSEDLVPLPSGAGPTSLKGEPTADGVRLSWTAPADAEGAVYNVYRARQGAPRPRAPLNAEPVGATDYLDTSVVTGSSYTYTVRVSLSPGRPYREGAESAPVDIVAEDRFAPPRPEGLVVVQEGPAVRLFWNPSPAEDVAGYRIYRRVGETEWELLPDGSVEQPQFRDRNLEVGRRATYRVTAIDRATPPNESEPSENVDIELLAEPVAPGTESS